MAQNTMPQFRWREVAHDVSLAKEVAGRRPSKPCDWEVIGTRLSSLFTTSTKPVHIKGRGCKDRMDRLLDKFRSDDAQSLKR